MATLAALLSIQGTTSAALTSTFYPPMSDFLAAERIKVLEGYRPEHVDAKPDLVVVGQRDLAPGTRSSRRARSRNPLRVDGLDDPRSWCGFAVDRYSRHPRQDHDHRVGRLAADGRRRRPDGADWGIARNFGSDGASRIGKGRRCD